MVNGLKRVAIKGGMATAAFLGRLPPRFSLPNDRFIDITLVF